MALMSPVDAGFLLAESREHPMHVGGLQLFHVPEGAGPEYVSDRYRELLDTEDLSPVFRRRPATPVSTLGQLWWNEEHDIDLEYHVRHSALPRPGRVRELLELVSRIHGTLLDRHRPLWELYVIEGLEGNRFATYVKIHHALADGVSAMRTLMRSLSEDPAVRTNLMMSGGKRRNRPGNPGVDLLTPLRDAASTGRQLVGLGPMFAKSAVKLATRESSPAPKSMFNVPITGARRFAAQSWSLDRIKAAGADDGATINDMILAMCAGALRRYLIAEQALPDRPLVAAVPVSLRTDTEAAADSENSTAGNAVGLVLCNLATTTADPEERLARIMASMQKAKAAMREQTPLQRQALAGALLGSPIVARGIPGGFDVIPPAFNLIISNVPGPRNPLYWNGALLEGQYPTSIPFDGQALNITITSYNGSAQFGVIGCRRQVPHLQHLLGYLEDSLAELE